MILHGLVEFLSVVGAPRMKGDEKGGGRILFCGGKEDGRLLGTVYGTGDAHFTDLAMEECRNEKDCRPRDAD
jgi:hypothetical protein